MQTTAKKEDSTPRPGSTPAGKGTPPVSRGMLWAGRIISGFPALFLLVDGGARLARFAPYVDGLVKFGYPERLGPPIGIVLVVCTLLYLVPGTAVLGAILLTGYLGGATATQVRAEDPWFLFPVVMGVLVWGGLYLRDPFLRALIPWRRSRER